MSPRSARAWRKGRTVSIAVGLLATSCTGQSPDAPNVSVEDWRSAVAEVELDYADDNLCRTQGLDTYFLGWDEDEERGFISDSGGAPIVVRQGDTVWVRLDTSDAEWRVLSLTTIFRSGPLWAREKPS